MVLVDEVVVDAAAVNGNGSNAEIGTTLRLPWSMQEGDIVELQLEAMDWTPGTPDGDVALVVIHPDNDKVAFADAYGIVLQRSEHPLDAMPRRRLVKRNEGVMVLVENTSGQLRSAIVAVRLYRKACGCS